MRTTMQANRIVADHQNVSKKNQHHHHHNRPFSTVSSWNYLNVALISPNTMKIRHFIRFAVHGWSINRDPINLSSKQTALLIIWIVIPGFRFVSISYRTRKEAIIPKREPMPDLLNEIKSGKVTEVAEMPASTDIDISRIPSRTPIQKKSTKDNINLDYVRFIEYSFDVWHINLYFHFTGCWYTATRPQRTDGWLKRKMVWRTQKLDWAC